MNNLIGFIQNKYIYIPVLLWFGIQLFKLIYDLVTTKKFNFKRIMGAGGMPSSHSAVVAGLATLVGNENICKLSINVCASFTPPRTSNVKIEPPPFGKYFP